jgi:hypothetical protein
MRTLFKIKGLEGEKLDTKSRTGWIKECQPNTIHPVLYQLLKGSKYNNQFLPFRSFNGIQYGLKRYERPDDRYKKGEVCPDLTLI